MAKTMLYRLQMLLTQLILPSSFHCTSSLLFRCPFAAFDDLVSMMRVNDLPLRSTAYGVQISQHGDRLCD